MSEAGKNKFIHTIGHSTRTLEEFLEILQSFQIEMLADIRSFPGSRKFPHFNKEALEIFLPSNNIQYFHIKKLGGRRKVKPDSKNISWRNSAFRGYADYMETQTFIEGISQLEGIALILPIDHFCDMFRSATNVLGNALATSVVGKWEGEDSHSE